MSDDAKPRLLWLPVTVVAIWLVIPPLVVIPMSLTGRRSFAFPPESWSFQWYRELFTDPTWLTSLQASFVLAVQVTLVSVVLGTLASFGLVRGRLPGKRLVETFGLGPLVVPLVVFGLGTYALFLRWGLVGTPVGFVVAHSVLALPYVMITVSSGLRTLDVGIERAAAVLGAGPARVFLRITLPTIAPSMLAGALFAFVTSFDEVVVALFISSPDLRTLPVEMFSSVTRDTDPTIAAASTLILVVTGVLIVTATLFLFRSREGKAIS